MQEDEKRIREIIDYGTSAALDSCGIGIERASAQLLAFEYIAVDRVFGRLAVRDNGAGVRPTKPHLEDLDPLCDIPRPRLRRAREVLRAFHELHAARLGLA
jgi:hypothetical protein